MTAPGRARRAQHPTVVECRTCLGYGHLDEDGEPSADRRDRRCGDCGGEGRAADQPPGVPLDTMAKKKVVDPENRSRSVRIVVRVDEGEAEHFKKAAEAAGLDVGTWVRMICRRAAGMLTV